MQKGVKTWVESLVLPMWTWKVAECRLGLNCCGRLEANHSLGTIMRNSSRKHVTAAACPGVWDLAACLRQETPGWDVSA